MLLLDALDSLTVFLGPDVWDASTFYHLPFAEAISQLEFEKILKAAQAEAQAADLAWRQQWECTFSTICTGIVPSLVYPFLSELAKVIAVGSLLLFMIKFARDLNEGNYWDSIPELIWPFIISALLSFGITISWSISPSDVPIVAPVNTLATIIVGLRNSLEAMNWAVVSLPAVVDVQPIQVLQKQAQIATTAPAIAQELLGRCSGLQNSSPNPSNSPSPNPSSSSSSDGSERNTCIRNQAQSVINQLNAYLTVYSDIAPFPWLNNQIAKMEELRDSLNSNDPLLRNLLFGLEGRRSEQVQTLSWQNSFRQLLDVALLLTGLAGPVAVGTSLLPVPFSNKAVISWMTGMFTVGMAKIFYNIITGMAAAVLLRSNMTEPFWFAVFLAYIAPVLATGLATGGGAALFNGLQAGVSPLISRGGV